MVQFSFANELEAIIAIFILLAALCQHMDGTANLKPHSKLSSSSSTAASLNSTTTTPSSTMMQSPPPSRAKILLQGDSLTQLCWEGWGAHVAHIYQRRADVIARGYGGYNTRFYRHLPVDTALKNERIALATLWLGTNDQALPQLGDHHHVPVEEYRDNLQVLIRQLRQDYGAERILLIGPPPVHHEQRLAYQIERYGKEKATGKLERTMQTAEQYSNACQQVARKEQLPFLNMYQAMVDEGDFGRFFYDGLHFSGAGHDLVGKAVVKAIQQAYPELTVHADPITKQWCNSASSCQALPDHGGPFHDDIDHTQPEEAFARHLSSVSTAAANNDQCADNDKKRKELA